MVDVAHGNVVDYNVFHPALINFFKCQSTAPQAGAVVDGNVAIATVRFCAQLDASAHPVDLLRNLRAIEQRAQLEARHGTVSYQYVLSHDRFLQCIRTFQYDGIVMGRVDYRVRYPYKLAAVYVNTVTVGINGDVVNGYHLAASGNDCEMSATEDGDIPDQHVAAPFQGYRLVTRSYAASLHIARFLRVVPCQPVTVYHPPACDAHVVLPISPYQRVVEIGVTAILVFGEAERLALVIGLHRGRCSNDISPSLQM